MLHPMRKYIVILTLGILALGVCSCRRSQVTPDEVVMSMREDVVFTASTAGYVTKASDASLEDGDTMGIFALEPLNYLNVKGTVSGTSVTPETPVKWQLDQTVTTRFVAYLPYEAQLAAVDYQFSVQADQSAYSGYQASDLRIAITDVRPGKAVDLVFNHALSKLIVDATCKDPSEEVTAVETAEVVVGAQVNLVDGSLPEVEAVKGTVKVGKAVPANGGEGFVAILPPQTGLFPLKLTLSSGRTVDCTLEKPAVFEPGFAYKATILVPREEGKVYFSLSIADWENGGVMPYDKPNE